MIHTPETRKKISDMRRGDRNPFYGKRQSDEFCEQRRQDVLTREISAAGRLMVRPQKIAIPGEPDLSYLAGIVDGEGSIRFRQLRAGPKPFVAVYNTNRPLIDWLLDQVGGQVAVDKRGRVPGYQWSVSAAMDVLALCRALRPRLIVKLDDCYLAIEHLEGKYGS